MQVIHTLLRMTLKSSRRLLSAIIPIAAVLLAGCISPRKKVAERLPGLESAWQAAVARQADLPRRVLDWPEAVALLETNNLKLRSARYGITNAQELAGQVFRDLIPNVDLRAGASKSITSIPGLSFDDVTFNIDSFFNVPGVVNFNARLFAGRLEVLRARAAYQLARREQSIELYKAFLESQEDDEIAGELKSERVLADAVRRADEFSGELMLKDIETRELSLDKSRESLQSTLGQLFAEAQFRWVLNTNGLPDFRYADQPLPLADTNRVARLQINLAALELVRAWAQIKGIKLQYWPELAIFVTGPSVFQVANGQNSFWSASQVIASANFFWTLDTRGYVRLQLRQTRREQELELAQLRQDSLDLVNRLLTAQRLAISLRRQLGELDRLIGMLDQVPQDMDIDSMLQAADSGRALRLQRYKLRHDLAEVNTLFWFVDETKWVAANTHPGVIQ